MIGVGEKADANAYKGLTLKNAAKSAVGMDAQVLAMRICDHLGVPYDLKFGRGFQLQTCCDALIEHYAAKGWVTTTDQ